jgi:methionyl-tRNA synthetase
MSARYTSELANDFGNLASRTIAMLEKYFAGNIPNAAQEPKLSSALQLAVTKADTAINTLDFQSAILEILEFCKLVNGYVTEKEPWQLAKNPDKSAELAAVLYNTAESLRALAVLFNSVMPQTCQKLWQALGAEKSLGKLADQRISDVAKWGQLKAGSATSKIEILFPKLEEEIKK